MTGKQVELHFDCALFRKAEESLPSAIEMFYKESKKAAVYTVKSFLRIALNADVCETDEQKI